MPTLRRPPLGRVRDLACTRLEYVRRAGRSKDRRVVVVVVGMHRSGTSAVTGTLQEAGLFLGDVSRKHETNRKGAREHVGIMKLHESILRHSGGSWRHPPQRIEWTDDHRRRRDEIIRSFEPAELWGFKDPRTLLLLDFWREELVDSLQLIGVFRHPVAVVSSLLRRDGGSAEEWFSLWSRYNGALATEVESRPFPLVEVTGQVGFREQMVPLLTGLGLRVPSRPRFFDPRLLHEPEPDVRNAMPDGVARLYERLRAAVPAVTGGFAEHR